MNSRSALHKCGPGSLIVAMNVGYFGLAKQSADFLDGLNEVLVPEDESFV